MHDPPPHLSPWPRWLSPLAGRPIFYGWIIVGLALVLTTLSSGVYVQGLTVFFLPLTEEFDVQRGTLSLALSLAGIGEAIIGPFGGMLIDRYGPRRLMVAGVILMGLGFALASVAQSFLVFLFVFLPLVPIGMSVGMGSALSAGVGNWFVRKRGMAFALAMTGFGLGGLLVPGVQLLIDSFGWRGAMASVAIIIWVVGLPVAALIRDRPERYGLYPDGASGPPEAMPAAGSSRTGEYDFTVREALRTRAFWLVGISFGLRMVVVASMNTQFIPILETKGVSASTGAAMLSLFSIVVLPSRLFIGWLSDRLPKNLIAAAMGGVLVISVLVLYLAGDLWHVYAFVVLYAVAWGGSGASMVIAIRAEYFGRKHFATIGGLSSAIMVFGTVGGPTFTGFSFDRTRDYDVAMMVFIAAAVASTFLMLLARRPASPAKRSAQGQRL